MKTVVASVAAGAALTAGAGWATGVGTGVAGAYPVIPAPPCSYALSPPEREGDVVTTTVALTGCGPIAQGYYAVACLQAGAGPTQCVQARGSDPATVTLPYQPGVPFNATGRGCSRVVNVEPGPECYILGPFTATL